MEVGEKNGVLGERGGVVAASEILLSGVLGG